jgi:hypothetical protein
VGRVRFWGRSLSTGAIWFYRALNHALFILGLLAAGGVVVAVSFGGPLWLIVLVLVLILLSVFAEGAYREWQETDAKVARQQSAELTQELLWRKCVLLSAGIDLFILERQKDYPRLTDDEQVLLAEGALPRAREVDYRVDMATYERETQYQYAKQFAQPVFEVVTGLRKLGFVPESDAEWLNYPKDVMQKECHHTRESLAEEVLYAHRLLLDCDGELAGERLLSTIRHMCERVERHEDGWLTVYGQCAEAANVEPHAAALLAAQEAIELVIAGNTIEEDS